ncbi:MAG: secondary thiamine-phosphate synthase enzyme YjbQ [Pseudothermotoga sp.]
MRSFTVKSSRREQLLDISHEVQRIVDESSVKEGICLIFVPHTTAAITINEGTDSSVAVDLLGKLSDLIPRDQNYRHLEGNADAHIKATLVGSSLALPINDGKLTLGTWQRIFFCEFDGPRVRTVLVQILSTQAT